MCATRARNSSWSRAGDLAQELKKTALAHSEWAKSSRRKVSMENLLQSMHSLKTNLIMHIVTCTLYNSPNLRKSSAADLVEGTNILVPLKHDVTITIPLSDPDAPCPSTRTLFSQLH